MTRAPLSAALGGLALSALAFAPARAQDAPAAPAAVAPAPTGRTPLDRTAVAVVEGDTLTAAAFDAAFADHLVATGRNDDAATRRAFLDEWIDRHLLAREAVRRGLDREPDFQARLALETAQAAAGRFLETEVFERLPEPTDRDLRWAYVRANTVRTVRVLFFRREDEARAAHARLQGGADFVALAAENRGLAAVDSLAGFLGPVRYYGAEDGFADAVFAANVGAITAPIRTRKGWYVARVEDAVYDALLTEDGYATRREGIASEFRGRRRRVEGDRFVRDYMAGLGVRINAEAVRLLGERLRTDGVTPEAALGVLRPAAPLDTYTQDGTPRTFTATDLGRWLPALPAGALRANPAAALGRAVRNEAFAGAGLARGLDRDLEARLDVERWRVDALAERMLTEAPLAAAEPSETDLREAYDRLRIGDAARAVVSYWAAGFATEAEAVAARDAAGRAHAPAAGAAVRESVETAAVPVLGDALRAAPVGTPVVYAAGDGRWYALGVTARQAERAPFEAVREALAAGLRADLQRIAFVRRLRATERVVLAPAALSADAR